MKLRIDKLVYGGAGLGRVAADAGEDALTGKAVFVPRTLAGEVVECVVTEDRRSFSTARLTQLVEASPMRVTPPCEYFPVCGGCHYQHAEYAEQLLIKQSILAEALAQAKVPLPQGAIGVLSGKALGYRNRIRLHIRYGDFALCYREAGSHRDLPVTHCPIAAPRLQQALHLFPEAAISAGVEAGLFEEIEFFTNAEQDTLLVSLWTSKGATATQAFAVLCEAMKEAMPFLGGGLLFQVESQKGQGRQQATWGDPSLEYKVGELGYRVSAGSFFQVNRFLLAPLLSLVTEGHSGAVVWDLYAGAGLFAQALARSFTQVVAVEMAASSVRDLRRNLAGGEHRVVAGSTMEFLRSQLRKKAIVRPEMIVVDPPRAGLGQEVVGLLSQIGTAKMIYVSCDPTRLARDLQWLLHSGYHPAKVTLVDLFPQTFHLETVVELVRETSPGP